MLLAMMPAVAAGIPERLHDLAGREWMLNAPSNTVRVFVFLSSECPVSQAKIPELNRLHARWGTNPAVKLWGVWSDAALSSNEAAGHFKEWRAQFAILHDSGREVAAELRPTHVPEAFVLNSRGEVLYRGAIDDGYAAIGKRRAEVSRRFLAEAVEAAARGELPSVRRTQAVGCLFEWATPPKR
jgi:hypothetical protein